MATTATPAIEVSARPHHTIWGDAFIRLKRNRLSMIGAGLILLLLVGALIVGFISPWTFDKQDLTHILEGPTARHWLGTDSLGRDIFTRLLYGARTSLAVGVFTQIIILAIGIPIGALAGSAGGRTDNVLMRFVDVMYAFPDILLIILLATILGGSIFNIFLAIGLVSWVNVARLIRGQILSLKNRDFVTAARAMGGTTRYRILRHLIPNSLGPIIVLVTFSIPRAIFAEAALSYIGIGVKPPTPSWGTMIRDGYDVIFAAPLGVVFPAVAIAILMLSFTFLGDGLRDALDPRLRK